jgi:hypothetical protein
MKILGSVILVLALSGPVSGQGLFSDDEPAVSVRPYFEFSQQRFSATNTFENVFGETSAPFWGVGGQVLVWGGRIYGEAGISRLLRENSELVGERVFASSGTVFRLGIPLRATIKPWKVAGGYRFRLTERYIAYAGAGFGSYHYTEESDFASPTENLDVTKRSTLFQAGVEVRAHRWVGVAAGVERAWVKGILGDGRDGNGSAESDLGGWSGQVRIVVGR